MLKKKPPQPKKVGYEVNDSHSLHFQSLIDQVTDKWLIKQLQKCQKHQVLSYYLALAGLVKSVIENKCNLLGSDEIHIIIHEPTKFDCVDYYKWLALVPALLGNKEMNLKVSVLVTEVQPMTLSNMLPIIDRYIKREVPKGRHVNINVYQNTLTDFVEEHDIQENMLFINNLPSNSIFSEETLTSISCINRIATYVCCEVSQYSVYQRLGFLSELGCSIGAYYDNKYHVQFKTDCGVKRKYCGYWYEVVCGTNFIRQKPDPEQSLLVDRVTSDILARGVRCNINKELSTNEDGVLSVFGDCEVDLKNNIGIIHFAGDMYRFQYTVPSVVNEYINKECSSAYEEVCKYLATVTLYVDCRSHLAKIKNRRVEK